MTTPADYDRDPNAITWARAKIQAEIDRCRQFADQANAAHDTEQHEMWRRLANRMQRVFLGGQDCVIAAFDERLPELARAVDHSIPPAVDRAVRRDHSLCGTHPCSDCR